jgi:hypothetical protein
MGSFFCCDDTIKVRVSIKKMDHLNDIRIIKYPLLVRQMSMG